MIDDLALLANRLQQLLGAIVRDTLFIAGDKKGNGSLGRAIDC